MALPMVHLTVAHQLVCSCDVQPLPAFYLGSIAPDAIHMRPGTGGEDKRVVHLYQDRSLDLGRVGELFTARWKVSRDKAFAEGYCVHLLTDYYWVREVVLPLQAELGGQMQMPRHELRTLYYNECDKIDLDLYDQQPWREDVWALLRSAQVSDFRGLLSQGEIVKWRDRVLSWFDANRDKGNYTCQHLTEERVFNFIADASTRACDQIEAWGQSIG